MTLLKNNQTLGLAVLLTGIWIALSSYGCQPTSEDLSSEATPKAINASSSKWNNYWYTGKAEVNSYRLSQSRYGQDRSGTSILVFVTEDFSKSKHVKLDNPNRSPNDKVSVLKTNMIRKFNTGIYDYSMMASVFTPVSLDQYPQTLKATASSQEWCGHTWTQYNLENKGYRIEGKSYFESEGDQALYLKSAILEDELWNRIRINPELVPTGSLKIIPSSFFSRLDHVPFKVESAILEKKLLKERTDFVLDYTSLNRKLQISVANEFPYKILGWSETTTRGTTSAELMKTMHIPYWSMNGNQFESYRDSLMLN